jgi:hypothetical protein
MNVTIRGVQRTVRRHRSNYLHCRRCKTRSGTLVLVDEPVDEHLT